MYRNNYKSEVDEFKKLVEETGITIYDFMDLYCEFSELEPEVKQTVINIYYKRIHPKDN